MSKSISSSGVFLNTLCVLPPEAFLFCCCSCICICISILSIVPSRHTFCSLKHNWVLAVSCWSIGVDTLIWLGRAQHEVVTYLWFFFLLFHLRNLFSFAPFCFPCRRLYVVSASVRCPLCPLFVLWRLELLDPSRRLGNQPCGRLITKAFSLVDF